MEIEELEVKVEKKEDVEKVLEDMEKEKDLQKTDKNSETLMGTSSLRGI